MDPRGPKAAFNNSLIGIGQHSNSFFEIKFLSCVQYNNTVVTCQIFNNALQI